ncbi:MAG: LLM class F420-dependent oxidoreductase [Deltaproteobacteria bacterium]|nr:LLM class F420-dependent oxidoreductase [Deltaproteobacteria bacterium]
MKLGLTSGGFGPKVQIDIERIKRAESMGFDSVWTAEAWGNDAIVPLAWIAAQTSKIKLGTAIMQMQARTPAMCAMQAMTLDQLSGGRMIVGLGPSGPQVIEGWHGLPYAKPLQRTREYVAILREIFRRERPVEFQGELYQMPYRGPGASGLGKPLRSILHGRPDIPIYTATISPKGVETAAEVADGFIPVWTTPDGLSTFTGPIEKGFAKAGNGKSWGDFEIAPTVTVILNDDVQKARDAIKPGLALYVGGMGAREKNFYNDHVSRQGWPGPAKKIQDLYLDGKKNEAAALVPDDLVDAVALVGPKERIRDRLAAWKESRATTLLVGGDSRALETVAELCL